MQVCTDHYDELEHSPKATRQSFITECQTNKQQANVSLPGPDALDEALPNFLHEGPDKC